MGNRQSEFYSVWKEGKELSSELIKLEFPSFENHLQVLNKEAKGVADGGVFSYSSLKHYDYDHVLNYKRRDALVFICEKVKEDHYKTFVFICNNFSYKMNLEMLKTMLKPLIAEDKVNQIIGTLGSEENFNR